jgi:predicted nucleic acid-binding protein
MVVIDATMLMLFFRPDVNVPGGNGKSRIDFAKERIENLVKDLEKSRDKIVVPTPVLSEILCLADAAASQQIIERLNKYSVFSVEPFGTRAAIEAAAMTRAAKSAGDKRGGSPATWAKVKYDRQIVAIAKVIGATTIYSDDEDVRKMAGLADIPVSGLADLPVPDEARQGSFTFDPQKKQDEPAPHDEADDDAEKENGPPKS